MAPTVFFRRFELKYLLEEPAYLHIRSALDGHMVPDEFGENRISSVYFDTPDYRMIRHSLEKPAYKEKLRLRAYGSPGPGDLVYMELKKKYGGVVYKRRVALSLEEAEAYLYQGEPLNLESQVLKEVEYLLHCYPVLQPSAYICYERLAFASQGAEAIRVTFDRDIVWRRDNLHLSAERDGELLLPERMRLMEVKVPGAMPLWLVKLLSALSVYPVSFSKYGAAYQKEFEEKKQRLMEPALHKQKGLIHFAS